MHDWRPLLYRKDTMLVIFLDLQWEASLRIIFPFVYELSVVTKGDFLLILSFTGGKVMFKSDHNVLFTNIKKILLVFPLAFFMLEKNLRVKKENNNENYVNNTSYNVGISMLTLSKQLIL